MDKEQERINFFLMINLYLITKWKLEKKEENNDIMFNKY